MKKRSEGLAFLIFILLITILIPSAKAQESPCAEISPIFQESSECIGEYGTFECGGFISFESVPEGEYCKLRVQRGNLIATIYRDSGKPFTIVSASDFPDQILPYGWKDNFISPAHSAIPEIEAQPNDKFIVNFSVPVSEITAHVAHFIHDLKCPDIQCFEGHDGKGRNIGGDIGCYPEDFISPEYQYVFVRPSPSLGIQINSCTLRGDRSAEDNINSIYRNSMYWDRFLLNPFHCTDGIKNNGEEDIDCGLTCGNLCQINEGQCLLLNASWTNSKGQAIYDIIEGERAYLKITGENCINKSLELNIYEDDPFFDDYIANISGVFSNNNELVVSWIAEWHFDDLIIDDLIGDPEYYFVAHNQDNNIVSGLLNVERTNAVCGDDILTEPEQCDDGNELSGDGCSSECFPEAQEPICGDGVINQESEECDDQNNINGDGCSSDCKTEVQNICGNGVKEGAESCDYGSRNGAPCQASYNNPGICCTPDCTIFVAHGPSCGDNEIDIIFGEQCDDGNELSGDGCSSDCKTEVQQDICGDGIISGNETCDGADFLAGSNLCSAYNSSFSSGNLSCANCRISTNSCILGVYECGNGIKEGAESCDYGSQNGAPCQGQYGSPVECCTSECTTWVVYGPSCGDGSLDWYFGEQCDDRNNVNGDGCDSQCRIEN